MQYSIIQTILQSLYNLIYLFCIYLKWSIDLIIKLINIVQFYIFLKSGSMVRMTTIHILGYMGKSAKSAIPELIPLLMQADVSDRIYAHLALERLGYEKTAYLV